MSEVRVNFSKLEAELAVNKEINNILHNQIVQVEEESWSNKQYSRRECLEIVGIPETVINRFLEESALNIFEELGVSIAPSEIETCHRVGPLSQKM